jgi:hypothetical protein
MFAVTTSRQGYISAANPARVCGVSSDDERINAQEDPETMSDTRKSNIC